MDDQIEDHTINIGASIGLALYPQHGDNAETLIERADAAMYAAKSAQAPPPSTPPSQ